MASDETKAIALRFRLALAMFETGVSMMRQNLKRRFPDRTEEEIDRLLSEWLMQRDKAPSGDGVGHPGSLEKFMGEKR